MCGDVRADVRWYLCQHMCSNLCPDMRANLRRDLRSDLCPDVRPNLRSDVPDVPDPMRYVPDLRHVRPDSLRRADLHYVRRRDLL